MDETIGEKIRWNCTNPKIYIEIYKHKTSTTATLKYIQTRKNAYIQIQTVLGLKQWEGQYWECTCENLCLNPFFWAEGQLSKPDHISVGCDAVRRSVVGKQ